MGLLSWLAAGAVLGVGGRRLLPGPAPTLGGDVLTGAFGGLCGGILATALGFGGLLAWDPRSLATAFLAALAALLAVRWRR